jgi:hypothetical protein
VQGLEEASWQRGSGVNDQHVASAKEWLKTIEAAAKKAHKNPGAAPSRPPSQSPSGPHKPFVVDSPTNTQWWRDPQSGWSRTFGNH